MRTNLSLVIKIIALFLCIFALPFQAEAENSYTTITTDDGCYVVVESSSMGSMDIAFSHGTASARLVEQLSGDDDFRRFMFC